MELLFWVGCFAISLAVLIAAAQFFTNSAEVLGLSLGMSSFATGVIIVSIGTSLPELISAIVAVNQQSAEIVAANVIGACLSNIFLVLGVASLMSKQSIKLGDQYIFIDLNFLMASTLIVVLTMFDGKVTIGEGLIGLIGYGVYTFYLLKDGSTPKDILLDGGVESRAQQRQGRVRPKDVLILVFSGVFIYLGARYTITSLQNLAGVLQISAAIVSITLLSLGTTLPEMVVSASAARQGKGDIAIGNILGSCIFNSLTIPGVATLFGTLTVSPEVLALPLPLYAGATLLFYLLTQEKQVSRWEGIVFLLIYILFVGKISNLL